MRRPLAAVALLLAAAAPGALAQGTPASVQPELRADVILGRQPAVQAGAGLQVPFGYYVRVGADAAVGVRTGTLTGGRVDGRVDLLGRFLLDPFRQSRFGFSAGAGLAARFEPGERTTPLLLAALDLELRQSPGWTPALQLGIGGGVRIGLVLRRGAAGAR